MLYASVLQQPSDTGPCHTDTEKQVEKLLSHNKELDEEVQELRQSQARSTSLFEEGIKKQKVCLYSSMPFLTRMINYCRIQEYFKWFLLKHLDSKGEGDEKNIYLKYCRYVVYMYIKFWLAKCEIMHSLLCDCFSIITFS